IFPLKKNEPRIVGCKSRLICWAMATMRAVYDDSAGIGKLYRRQDEIGTPFCITVDFDTLGEGKEPDSIKHKDTVTIRHRDSMEQERVLIAELETYLLKRLK
ncbi:MAG: glycine--tRNA ligase, partial [Acidobacteria bacterium]|nr:glycine--tRNA ligase [Acidobacteriota bacterium]